MRGTVVMLLLAGTLGAGCATKGAVEVIRQDLAALRMQVSDDTSSIRSRLDTLDKKTEAVSVLQADLQAVKSYFGRVSERVRRMRDDVVKILDEHNLRIDGTQQTQLRLLQRQKRQMEDSIIEIDRAIKILQKALPEPAEAVTKEPKAPDLKSREP